MILGEFSPLTPVIYFFSGGYLQLISEGNKKESNCGSGLMITDLGWGSHQFQPLKLKSKYFLSLLNIKLSLLLGFSFKNTPGFEKPIMF